LAGSFSPDKHSTGVEKTCNGLLIPVNDADALAEAMLTMMDNDNMRNDYAAAGIRRAKDFDLPIIMTQYASLLHQF
jgi:glycosyltransferase involved in cell wall biosynthesis